MAVSRTTLEAQLKTNIVEIKWVRRIDVANRPVTRRALATNSRIILNTLPGKTLFRFTPPRQPNDLNTAQLNLVTYFDLFMLDYRNISCESATIKKIVPVATKEQQDEWWKFFDDNLKNMNVAQKLNFMNT